MPFLIIQNSLSMFSLTSVLGLFLYFSASLRLFNVIQRCMLFLYCTYMYQSAVYRVRIIFYVYISSSQWLYYSVADCNFLNCMILYHKYAKLTNQRSYAEKSIFKRNECQLLSAAVLTYFRGLLWVLGALQLI